MAPGGKELVLGRRKVFVLGCWKGVCGIPAPDYSRREGGVGVPVEVGDDPGRGWRLPLFARHITQHPHVG